MKLFFKRNNWQQGYQGALKDRDLSMVIWGFVLQFFDGSFINENSSFCIFYGTFSLDGQEKGMCFNLIVRYFVSPGYMLKTGTYTPVDLFFLVFQSTFNATSFIKIPVETGKNKK